MSPAQQPDYGDEITLWDGRVIKIDSSPPGPDEDVLELTYDDIPPFPTDEAESEVEAEPPRPSVAR